MWLPRSCILLVLVALARCDRGENDGGSSVFLGSPTSFMGDGDSLGLQGMLSAFVESGAGKQVGEIVENVLKNMLTKPGSSGMESATRMMAENLFAFDSNENTHERTTRETEQHNDGGIDLNSILNIGSMLLSQDKNNFLMGLMPMILENLSDGGSSRGETGNGQAKSHDHSGHSWYMPPILENLHVMWEHFSNSELGQTLWKNSGLSKIVAQMSDPEGHILYGKILDSFENPALRRRWIRSLTNYVGEWISHVSDPTIQQRYLNTIQFVGNSFLKSQGFSKTAMFDASRPTDSIARIANALAKRHLGMKIDSSQYIRPAVAYIQELIALASEKGFIMSRVNAREISNRLSDTINNDIINPILKSYRAYKWAIKTPHCASQVLCTINEKAERNDSESRVRSTLLKISSFPAAWAASNKLGINFWVLYGAIMEHSGCIQKYPADCTEFHEEEVRVTTESVHNEL